MEVLKRGKVILLVRELEGRHGAIDRERSLGRSGNEGHRDGGYSQEQPSPRKESQFSIQYAHGETFRAGGGLAACRRDRRRRGSYS